MKQYVIKNGAFFRDEVPFDFISPKYDDVVDRSSFSLTSDPDSVRIQALSHGSGKGVYDDPDNLPDDLVVKVRSGKFDRVEVQKIKEDYVKKADLENKTESLKKESDQLKKIDKARQEYLDRRTGFTGVPSSE